MNTQERPGRHFDVLVFSDFRFPGGTSTSIARALRALNRGGYQTGLIHIPSSVFPTNRPFHPEIVDAVREKCAEFISQGSQILKAGLALFQNPLVFREPLAISRSFRVEKALLILNQPVANAFGEPYYDLHRVIEHCQKTVHTDVTVAPISGINRENFRMHFPRMEHVLTDDWTEIIDAESFAVDRRSFRGEVPVIGRHSRPGDEKWPSSAANMLAAYPDRDDVRVRMLGVGRKVTELLGSPPANWELFRFGDLDVHYFLSTIDFWVYFHDDAWVESFGRAIAEAMASGAVTLLPEHFRKSFSDGAIYCSPAEVIDIVDHLYGHPTEYRHWSRQARRVIERDFGEDRYLERVASLIGAPSALPRESAEGGAEPDVPAPPSALLNETPRRSDTRKVDFDVVYAGDFRTFEEDWTRVADEVALLHRNNVTVGVVHLPLQASEDCVNADLVSRVHDGACTIVNPKRSLIDAGSLVLTTSTLEGILKERPVHHIFAERIILLCDNSLDSEHWLRDLHRLQEHARELYGGSCVLSAVRPSRYRQLQGVEHLPNLAPPWSVGSVRGQGASLRIRIREIAPELPWRLGLLCDSGESVATDSAITDALAAAANGDWQLVSYGRTFDESLQQYCDFMRIDHTEISFERLLAKIDALAVLSANDRGPSHTTAVRKALRSGLPVILPESLREDFGSGPLYRHPSELVDTLRQLRDRPGFRREILDHSAHQIGVSTSLSAEDETETLSLLAGRMISKPKQIRSPTSRRVLFMSSNGVGIGHLTRLIAIARRLPSELEPVFLSLSQALPVVRQFGFHGEFLPYHLSTLSDYEDWNRWLQISLERIFDAYEIGTVVFDGNMPYSGLCRAVSIRRDCRMVWVRRGMWRSDQDNRVHLSRSRYADLIVEPDDIASDLDVGAVAARRHEVVVVDPICVLDADEILTRRESCRKLGLNQRKRYALIQLGAGNNFANIDLIDQIIATFREIGKVQPVLAEWLTSETPLDLWPDVPRLRCYPISRYCRAFDFTVSAVGYNSFNEIISFGLPSVLIPNLNQMMDDQSARAAYADNNQAAIHVDEELRPMLREVIAAIHDEKLRRNLIRNCRRLARPNGAQEAARIVAEVTRTPGGSR